VVTLAFVVWGMFPVYFKWLTHLPALEVLAHRILWGAVICLVLVTARGEIGIFLSHFRRPKVLASSLLSGTLIAGNWLCFIYAVEANLVLESSLGYFLSPLLMVLLGMLIYAERLKRLQVLAIIVAVFGVGYQVYAYGRIPYYALGLAFTFALYGIVRKRTSKLTSLQGLALETLLLTPLALVYLLYLKQSDQLQFGTTGATDMLLLVGVGGITLIPLLLFAAGSRLIPYSTSGVLQYITPTAHFLFGIFLFHEPLSTAKGISFTFIWIAVALYMLSLSRRR